LFSFKAATDRLSRGDRVRVSGYFTGGYFTATNLTILRNR
jgi:hypothetical protein